MKIKSVIAVFVTSVILVTTLVFGCGADLNESKSELGPEVTEDQVSDAVIAGIGGRSILDAGQDEAVHIETNQKVEMGSAQVVMDEITSVFHRAENDDTIKYVIDYTMITYPDGEAKVEKIRSKPIYFDKKSAQSHSPTMESIHQNGLFKPSKIERILSNSPDKVIKTMESGKDMPDKITLHNLRVKRITANVPKNVAEAKNCLDIPSCQLPATEVKYDIAYWKNGDWKKVNVELILSVASPYLARILQRCQGTYINIPSLKRDVYIRECAVVRDFRFPTHN